MRPPTAAADSGRDWPALWRLLLLEGSGFTRAVTALAAAEEALRHDPLGVPAAMARWKEAGMAHRAALEGLAEATRTATLAVVSFARGLRDADRRALAGPVRAYARELLGPQAASEPPLSTRFEVRRARAYALRVAGAGCFTGAGATAEWLARRDLQGWSVQVDHGSQTAAVLDVLRVRDPRWLAEVARRLAGRLRSDDRQATSRLLWETTAALVQHAGIDPPTSDGFVHGWALARTASWPAALGDHDHRALVDRLRDDPFLDTLGPHLLEVDEAGELLLWGTRPSRRLPAEHTWPGALAQLAAEGRLDRAALLDRCLGRLLRGGPSNALGGFLALHEALDPDLDELAARLLDYRRLLPDAQPAVAGLAQRMLRRLDDAGRLDRSVLLEASGAVLFRTERKLVRAQLAWLDAAARRGRGKPDELREVLCAVAAAFQQDPADLQERALALVRRQVRHLSASGRAALLDATAGLPHDLRRRVAEAVAAARGAGAAEARAPVGQAAPLVSGPSQPPPARRMLPPPIGTPAELAEELAALLHDRGTDLAVDQTLDPIALERVLAALISFAHADRAAVHEVLVPVLLRHSVCPPGDAPDRASWNGWAAWLRSDDPWYWYGARTAVGMIAAAAAMSPAAAFSGGTAPSRDEWLRLVMSEPRAGRHPWRSRPRQAIIYRLREIGTGLLHEPVPTLLATPSTAAGHVDPDVLLDKLARAEREGWRPWELDLQLALLRLPRETGPAVLDRARRLRSPAGRRLADRLETGGPPDPALARVVRTYPRPSLSWAPAAEIDRTRVLAARVASPPPTRAGGDGGTRRSSPGQPPSLVDLLFDLDPPERLMPEHWAIQGYPYAGKLCWPALLPGHRDLAAAHLLPALSSLPHHNQCRGLGAVLPPLAEADGPVGVGLTLALAHSLGARERADRAAAADALVILAGRGQLDGAALGRELAGLVALGLFPVQRLVEPLRDVALSDAAAVWTIVAAALPRLLPPAVGQAPQRLAALVALGAQTAVPARASGPIPEMTAIVERGGSSQLAAESRRLHRILTTS